MPRKPEGDRPLTAAERQARRRERKLTAGNEMLAALQRIHAARTIREARQIAGALLKTHGTDF
jgi:hypothetical protein